MCCQSNPGVVLIPRIDDMVTVTDMGHEDFSALQSGLD